MSTFDPTMTEARAPLQKKKRSFDNKKQLEKVQWNLHQFFLFTNYFYKLFLVGLLWFYTGQSIATEKEGKNRILWLQVCLQFPPLDPLNPLNRSSQCNRAALIINQGMLLKKPISLPGKCKSYPLFVR